MTRHRISIRGRGAWARGVSGRPRRACQFERLESRSLLAAIMDAGGLVLDTASPPATATAAVGTGASASQQAASTSPAFSHSVEPHRIDASTAHGEHQAFHTELWLTVPRSSPSVPQDRTPDSAVDPPSRPPLDVPTECPDGSPLDSPHDAAPSCDGDLETKQGGEADLSPGVATGPEDANAAPAPRGTVPLKTTNPFVSLTTASITPTVDQGVTASVDAVFSTPTEFRYFSTENDPLRSSRPSLGDEPLSKHIARDTMMTLALLKPQNERASLSRKLSERDSSQPVTLRPPRVSPTDEHEQPIGAADAMVPAVQSQTRLSPATATTSLCSIDATCKHLVALASVAPCIHEPDRDQPDESQPPLGACGESPDAEPETSTGATIAAQPWVASLFAMVSLILSRPQCPLRVAKAKSLRTARKPAVEKL